MNTVRPRVFLLMVVLSTLAACKAMESPVDRWFQAASTVAGVNDTVADLNAVGVLTDEEVATDLRPFLDTMNRSLDAAQLRLPEGGTSFEALMDTLMSARLSAEEYLRRRQGSQ